VANHDNDYRYPEDLLVGADRPRQLPLAMRARLEDALTDQRSRPLSPEVRGRLENSLRPRRAPRKWTAMAPGLAAAAVIVVVAALVVPGLVHKSPANTSVNNIALPAQHGPGPLSGQSPAAAPSFARAGGTAAKTKQHAASGTSGLAGLHATAQRGSVPLFVMVPPAVDGVNPRSGPATGATWVVVTGAGLGGVTQVHFGTVAAERVDVVSAHEVRALAPVHSPGTVDIVAGGQIRKSPVSPADRYTFTP
jgi:negative regulator of sigma E activity